MGVARVRASVRAGALVDNGGVDGGRVDDGMVEEQVQGQQRRRRRRRDEGVGNRGSGGQQWQQLHRQSLSSPPPLSPTVGCAAATAARGGTGRGGLLAVHCYGVVSLTSCGGGYGGCCSRLLSDPHLSRPRRNLSTCSLPWRLRRRTSARAARLRKKFPLARQGRRTAAHIARLRKLPRRAGVRARARVLTVNGRQLVMVGTRIWGSPSIHRPGSTHWRGAGRTPSAACVRQTG